MIMSIKNTACFFGHRNINESEKLRSKLIEIAVPRSLWIMPKRNVKISSAYYNALKIFSSAGYNIKKY